MRTSHAHGPGFTLIELLVVISIIALLVGILLPALGAARKTAQRVQCASRVRQVTLAMMNYANENDGLFPPNFIKPASGFGQPAEPNFWFDVDRIGGYLPALVEEAATGSIGGGVLACPSDEPGVARTYIANLHSSSQTFVSRNASLPDRYFSLNTVRSTSKVFLITEGWAYNETPNGFLADADAGDSTAFRPAVWFGLNGTVNKAGLKARFGAGVKSTIRYNLHADADNEAFQGVVNVGYLDGHVSNTSPEELVNASTAKSTYNTLWSDIDEQVEQ